MKKTFNKLARDNIPDLIRKKGEICSFDVLEGTDLEKVLVQKLDEEVSELKEALNGGGWQEEMADVFEVLFALIRHKGSSLSAVESLRKEKLDERGGFEKGIYLKSIDEAK